MALPFQPVPKTVEIAVQGTLDGQLVENKFYVQAVEGITSAIVNELVDITVTWFTTHALASLSTAYTGRRIVGRDLSVEAGLEVEDTSIAGMAGTAGTAALPGNVTIAIHRATGFSGKKAKSRIYWPALTAGSLASPNVITTGTKTALINTLEQLREALIGGTEGTYAYGYPQRVLDGVRLSVANFVEVFGHSMTDLFIDSMRRRLDGRGV